MREKKVANITEQNKFGLIIQKAGVYIARCKGEVVYVGSTNNLAKRQSTHLSALRKGYHSNKKLQELYDSLENKDDLIFSAVTTVSEKNRKQLFEIEDKWMEEHKETILNRNRVTQESKLVRSKEEQDAISEIFRKANEGVKNPMCRLSEDDAREIIELKDEGVRHKIIADKLDVSVNYVSRIGKDRWSHLS